MGKMRMAGSIGIMAVFFWALAIGACATNGKVPSEKIRNAEQAIDRARQNGAVAYAPLEIRLAEDKLKAAEEAMKKEEYETARRLADEAFVDAQVAEQKAQGAKSLEAAQELQKTVDTLRRELKQKPATN